jgi:spore coat polysaccharide biosynthesis protein SpsF
MGGVSLDTMSDPRIIRQDEWLDGSVARYRLIAEEDCAPRYVEWLNDPEVNRYLETRWEEQNLASVKAFVHSMVNDPSSYLFGIFVDSGRRHIGNIKLGPINSLHGFADISYFIGERDCWGKGIATDAIGAITRFGFERLALHRVQAGLYASNVGSARALERSGFRREGCFREKARTAEGREDVYQYAILADEWKRLHADERPPKVVAVLQARSTSTRLPGKVLKPILGEPMLARQIERIQRSREIDRLIVATSEEASDDSLAQLCSRLDVPCFRGSLNDVLDRFFRAVEPLAPAYVVRLTGDCPLADPDVIDAAILMCKAGHYDYVTNALHATYPDGLDVEVFTYASLAEAHREASLLSQREHVTPFINRQPERFKIGELMNAEDLSALRWTVDESEDFALVARIYEELYPLNPAFRMNDVLALLERHPGWKTVNTAHKRNEGYEKSLEKDRVEMEKAK